VRLASYNGGRIGRVEGQEIVDLTPLVANSGQSTGFTVSPMRVLIAQWDKLGEHAASADGPRLPLSNVILDPPVRDPSKILAAPVNYADHQSEMNSDSHVSGLGLFLKSPSSLLRPSGTVRLPYFDRRFDQEGELALVIARHAERITADPLSYVFGYTGLMDVTMRGGEDRSTRKSFATFTPLGPWIVTPDEFGDPGQVDLQCSVNGEVRQSANTRDLIWGVPKLVQYASWISPLVPGDVITTGTPAGVDELVDGDSVTLSLSGLGAELVVSVSDEGAVRSHTGGKDRGPTPPPSTRTKRR
jgi:2-keto-4-pentenoate hydratase/2-oxohepta-3-ene-1,7-dioic acid hydratase in catechol pathway